MEKSEAREHFEKTFGSLGGIIDWYVDFTWNDKFEDYENENTRDLYLGFSMGRTYHVKSYLCMICQKQMDVFFEEAKKEFPEFFDGWEDEK
jgi:hypothetical protein